MVGSEGRGAEEGLEEGGEGGGEEKGDHATPKVAQQSICPLSTWPQNTGGSRYMPSINGAT